MQETASLLDPEAISRGESLGLLARRIVEGYRVGEHRSPFSGFALEFAQHREYGHGDDIRHLDWKVLGKTDRYYIKQYEQDTNFVAHLIIDASSSMDYGSGPLTKLHFAKALAACLAFIILSQRDAIALTLFDSESRYHQTRTDSLAKLPSVLNHLATLPSRPGTNLALALDQVAASSRARGIIIIISDFLDAEDGLHLGLQKLAFLRHEIITFHVLDPHELTFPFEGSCRFQGLESNDEILATPRDIRSTYLAQMDAFRTRIRTTCEKFNSHYVLADTGKPIAEVLSAYLAFRRAAGKK